MKTEYNIGENVYIVDQECMFCTNSVDHCDFGCSKYNCYVIKEYKIITILIEKDAIYYFCEDDDKNRFKFKENDTNIFLTDILAKNYLAKLLSTRN